MEREHSPIGSDRGMITPVSLVFLMILMTTGIAAAVFTSTDLKIGTNHKTSVQATYVAQAGIEEARGRLKADAANPITDGHPSLTQWSAFIGSDAKTMRKGFNPGNAMHIRTGSIQANLDYTVRISHQTDSAGNILYYGDVDGDGTHERNTGTGENIYLLSSTGYATGSQNIIEAEVTRLPPITILGALYVKAWTTIQGNVDIDGNDSCGTDDQPGIASTLASGTVSIHGSPSINGVGGTDPDISYDMTEQDIQSIIETFKSMADFTYEVESVTHTSTTSPGPGDGWGTPTPGATSQDPSTCSLSNIVYYDTGGTDITLSGGTSGCGVLLVEGDLEIHAGFNWHGVVITTGAIVFTGGGNRNITGAIIAGGSVLGDLIGGNVSVVYCSSAITAQTESRSLKRLTWKEVL